MSGIFFCSFGFLCVKNSTKCCPFFCLAFSRLWCLPILKVLLFLGVVRRGFLSVLVPQGRFWRKVLGSAVFLGFLMVSFSYVLVCAGFFVRKFVLLVLGFSRNYRPEMPQKFFFDRARFLRPSLIRTTAFWRLLVELFLWTGSLPPSQGRVLP